MTIDKSIVKKVSQPQHQVSEAPVICLININALTTLVESQKNAFEFTFATRQDRDDFHGEWNYTIAPSVASLVNAVDS